MAAEPASSSRWRAMGSDVHLVVVGHAQLVGRARRRLADLEARWSRFLPGSEVSRLNDAGGRALPVSAETRLLVERALLGWQETGGLFDPTVLGDVVRAGYDRSFDRLGPVAAAPSSTWGRGAAGVVVTDDGRVRLPPGVAFDPGGVGKGLAADLVADELVDAGATGACVNVGGDLRVRGAAPRGGAWLIDVDDPAGDGVVARVALADGGVATSSRLRRRWIAGGEERHHLIDPRDGRPARTTTVAATVVAAAAWQAEVLAKAAFFAGPGHGIDVVDALGAAALVVDEDGAVLTTATWPDVCIGEAA